MMMMTWCAKIICHGFSHTMVKRIISYLTKWEVINPFQNTILMDIYVLLSLWCFFFIVQNDSCNIFLFYTKTVIFIFKTVVVMLKLSSWKSLWIDGIDLDSKFEGYFTLSDWILFVIELVLILDSCLKTGR